MKRNEHRSGKVAEMTRNIAIPLSLNERLNRIVPHAQELIEGIPFDISLKQLTTFELTKVAEHYEKLAQEKGIDLDGKPKKRRMA